MLVTPASAWLPLVPAVSTTRQTPHTPPSSSASRSSSTPVDLRSTFLPIPFNSLPTPRISVGILPVSRQRTRDEWAEAVKAAVLVASRKRVREYEGDQQIEMRGMRRTDVEMVRQLQDASLPLSYPSIFYTHLLTSTNSLCLLAVCPFTSTNEPALKGCISARLLPPPSHDVGPAIYLQSLAIDQSARRSGLATRLFNKLIEGLWDDYARTAAREGCAVDDRRIWVSLHVLEENLAARRLYARLGLEELQIISGFYSRLGGKSAIEMGGWIVV